MKDILMHYGVKGMKWGVRHDPVRTGRNNGSSNLASNTSSNGKTSKYKSKETQIAVDAWKKHDEVHWNEVDPARDKWLSAKEKYGDNDPRTKKAEEVLTRAINKREQYTKMAVDRFKDIPYDDLDEDALRIGQHASTWKYDVKVEDIDNYKGPTIDRWSKEKQDFEPYKFESINPNVEILGDAPGGEIALRRRPKKADPVADAKAAQKRKDDLARSEIQDLKDAYRLTGDRSYLKAAKERERKYKKDKSK